MQSPMIPLVGALVQAHPGTLSLGQGVVGYGPPPQALEQITQFLSRPDNHKYKPVQGLPELREALADKLARENGIDVGNGNALAVTAGGNQAFVNAVLAIADVGDEIILLSPFYFNHDMAIAMIGCRAVSVETDENYQPRLDALDQAITEKTRAIVTISPNNPTGAVYPEATLRAINDLCRKHGIYHISDEAYEYFTYGEARHFSPGSITGSQAHTISLYSFSKAYGFASWRIGYMVMPDALWEPIKKIQDTIVICPPVISQFAALGCLEAGAAYARERLVGIAANRDRLLDALQSVRGHCAAPPAEGAFYVFLTVQTEMTDMQIVERLVKEQGVAVLPGSTFGVSEGCRLRIAYAALDTETAEEGIERLVRGLEKIAR